MSPSDRGVVDVTADGDESPSPVHAEVPPDGADLLFADRWTAAARFAELLCSDGVDQGHIGPREPPRIWTRHILNCAVVGRLVTSGDTVLDLGSGAGLPGIPLALARPDVTVVCLEPMLRRTRFLTAVVDELGLRNVTVVRGRADDVTICQADVVTARAVSALPTLWTWGARHLTPRGRLLAIKGVRARAELDYVHKELAVLGVTHSAITRCGAPGGAPDTVVIELRGRLVPSSEPRRSR